MSRGFNLADVNLLQLFDVTEDLSELFAELLLFFRSEAESRELSDIFDIEVTGHGVRGIYAYGLLVILDQSKPISLAYFANHFSF